MYMNYSLEILILLKVSKQKIIDNYQKGNILRRCLDAIVLSMFSVIWSFCIKLLFVKLNLLRRCFGILFTLNLSYGLALDSLSLEVSGSIGCNIRLL